MSNTAPGVNVVSHLKAETEATVNATTLTGNIFNGPLTINYSSSPARNEPQKFQETGKKEEHKTALHDFTEISRRLKKKLKKDYQRILVEETQEKFELQKYRRSDEAVMRLLPVIKNTRKALLCGCNLTSQACESLSSVLKSSNSVLRELDLSNNDLKHSGVNLLTDGLKSPDCKLKILRLCGCNLTTQSCESLSSALQSSTSNILKELDLSNNDLQDSGVNLLSDGLKSPNCQLEILRLSGCMPLRRLMAKGIAWHRLPKHDKAVQEIKHMITDTVLKYYDIDKPVTVQSKVSKNGLGCCLLQQEQPLAFASQTLNRTEQTMPKSRKNV
ncbi:hypothetical protein QQF64_018534 [Cirrhinus molitorella]|uniref:Reverse transcriptase/retrotransposon-derived protein RNase H-like domain-containing protein n=1 Tax=Cirrhinus molitorella TaxID=172907 RepID=A0ABR3LCZ1_9TELE